MTSNKSYSAVKWNGINSLFSQAVTFILGALLMRLLAPEDFGLLGMVTVFTGFLNVLKDSGLGSSLIYRKTLKPDDINTVFWFNVFMGLLLSLFLFSMSYPLAIYYEEIRLNDIVKVYSLIFTVSASTIVPTALLTKYLQFKKKFIVESFSVILSGVLGVFMALANYGVWSLIAMHLFRVSLHALILWFIFPFKPQLAFSFSVLKSHFGYSLPVFGTKSFNYWTRNADNLFIGKLLGSEALGFYSRAFFFVTFPVQRFTNVLGGVLFPVMTQGDYTKNRIRQLLIRAIRLVALVTFPLMGLLIVSAEPFILLVFGSQWLPMLPALRILSVLAMLESVLVLTTPVFYALGATKLNFKISVVLGLVNILIFYVGAQYSIETVAWLLLVSTSLFTLPRVYFVIKMTDAVVGDFINAVGKTFLITICAMTGVVLLSRILTGSPLQLFMIFSSTHLTVYLLLSLWLSRKEFEEVKNSVALLLK